MKVLIIFFSLFFSLQSCEKIDSDCPIDYHTSFILINKSKKNIFWENYFDYPSRRIGNNSPLNNKFLRLLPNEKFEYYSYKIRYDGSCWESKMKSINKINIYFFDADIIDKIDWKEVQEKKTGLLEIREIDLDYLIKNNFEVVYE